MARDAAGSIHCGSFIEEKLFRNGVALGLSDCSLSAKTNTLLAPCLGSHRGVGDGSRGSHRDNTIAGLSSQTFTLILAGVLEIST